MKKTSIFLLPAIALLFISCENFLDGGDVKEEIERAIYIANPQCPEATVEPAFSETGLARNRAIIVNFSMPVNPYPQQPSMSQPISIYPQTPIAQPVYDYPQPNSTQFYMKPSETPNSQESDYPGAAPLPQGNPYP